MEQPASPPAIENFGRNVRFRPRACYTPASEDEVCAILERHRGERIRAVGSLHSWNGLLECPDVVIDLRRMGFAAVERSATGDVRAVVEAGCTVERLLRVLDEDAAATLPAIGAVTRQTIAGAIATGTHGSGQHSISHHVEAVRVASYGPDGKPVVHWIEGGDALRAARCALGCMGIVLSVRLRCVRQYWVVGTVRQLDTLEEALDGADAEPLQYFLLAPFLWRFAAFRRHATPMRPGPRERLRAAAHRLRYRITVDWAFHFLFTRAGRLLRRPERVRALYRLAFPLFLAHRRPVVDRSDRALTIRHHYFRHVEMELAVPVAHLARATDLIRYATERFAGRPVAAPDDVESTLRALGLWDELEAQAGSHVQSYPLSYRQLRPDDTLISQSADATGPLYTISFFSYEPRSEGFLAYASFLARSLAAACDARPHWGKILPLAGEDLARVVPGLEAFRRECRAIDPDGRFRNEFTERILGFADA